MDTEHHLRAVIARIQDGDVFTVEGKSLFAKGIQGRTNSPHSHTGFLAWLSFGEIGHRLCVIEAVCEEGVRVFPFDRYLELCAAAGEKVHWFRLLSPGGSLVVIHAMEQWGKPYSYRQLAVSFGYFHGLWRWATGSKPADLEPENYFCSELVIESFEETNLLPKDGPAYTKSPADVAALSILEHQGVVVPDSDNKEVASAVA